MTADKTALKFVPERFVASRTGTCSSNRPRFAALPPRFRAFLSGNSAEGLQGLRTYDWKRGEIEHATGSTSILRLIARAGSAGERQAAEQSISRLITTHSKTVIQECTFSFPDYGSLRLYQTVCKQMSSRPTLIKA